MKYIVTKPAKIFRAGKKGILHIAGGTVHKKSILSGEIKKMSVSTVKGVIVMPFLEIISPKTGTIYIHAGAVTPYQSKGGDESSSFSGSEAIAKVGGADVIIPVAVFGGLGFVIGSIIGENKVQLALGGAVIGGLIGASGSMSGAKMMSAEGRQAGSGRPRPTGGDVGGGIMPRPAGGHSGAKETCHQFNSKNECTDCRDKDGKSVLTIYCND